MRSFRREPKTVPLQRRGQFFVRDIGGLAKDVPIDNFIFATNDRSEEIQLETVSGSTNVIWTRSDATRRHETFYTYAFGLRRMANILEGKVRFEEFGLNSV